MSESFKERVKKWKRHLSRHARKVLQGEEEAGQALSGVAKETGRFVKHLHKPKATKDRKLANTTLKKGIEHYNNGNYEKARRYFKRAISEDHSYARAYTYLGNALYKLGDNVEAGVAWSQAVKVDPHSEAAAKAREKIKKTGHGEVGVIYAQKQSIKKQP